MVHIIYDTSDYNGKRVVVRKNVRSINGNFIDKNKNWVVTSFDNNIPKSKKTSTATIATPNGNEGSRAVTPDVSIGKDKNNLFNDNTRTKEFKEWFGDWENDKENASKVVDKNGEPLVVYHWSQGGINTFDLEKARTTSEVQGFFFMGDPVSSKEYGDTKYGVYLNMRNPYIVDTHEKMKFAYPDLSKTDDGIRVREMLQEMGYDGIIRKAEYTGNESDEYIVFSPIYQKMNKKTFFLI